MKIQKIVNAAAVLSLVLMLQFPSIASAASDVSSSIAAEDGETNAVIVKLLEKNPGTSYAEIERAIKDAAQVSGVSETVVARAALDEAEEQSRFTQNKPQSSSEPKANKPVGWAHNRGDVFYTPAATIGINHGHSGIYTYRTKIVESIPGSGVVERSYTDVKVSSGAHKQRVLTSQANRNKAADQARAYIGRGYNYNFGFNKTANGAMNCSQTVWAAYKSAAGIDLDSDGGYGVYPSDILNSRHTDSYQIF